MLIDKVLNALCSIGVYVEKNDFDTPLNVLIEDSLTFVAFVVELEKEVGRDIPDEFLQEGLFENLNDFLRALATLVE